MLVAAGPAAAKEVVAAKVCGAGDCRTFSDSDADLTKLGAAGGYTTLDRRAPWYRMVLLFRAEGTDRVRVPLTIVPAQGLVRWEGDDGDLAWATVPAETLRLQRRLTAGLEPRPAASLESGAANPAEARVDEVVLIDPPTEGGASPSGGGVSTSVAAAGGGVLVVLLGVGVFALGFRRVSRSSLQRGS